MHPGSDVGGGCGTADYCRWYLEGVVGGGGGLGCMEWCCVVARAAVFGSVDGDGYSEVCCAGGGGVVRS